MENEVVEYCGNYVDWPAECIKERQTRHIKLGQWQHHLWLHRTIWTMVLSMQRHRHVPSEIWERIVGFMSPFSCTVCGNETQESGLISEIMCQCLYNRLDPVFLAQLRSDDSDRYSDFGMPYVAERMCYNCPHHTTRNAYQKFCLICEVPLQLICCKSYRTPIVHEVTDLKIFVFDQVVLPTQTIETRGNDDEGIIGVRCPQCKFYYEYGVG